MGFYCNCTAPWGGDDCSVSNTCPDNCAHHGSCHEGTCICRLGYTGANCSAFEQATCPGTPMCGGHGECFAPLGTCTCDPGFSGDDCTEKVTCKNDCSGHGTCSVVVDSNHIVEGLCECEPGFSGDDCSVEALCPNQCSGNGVCGNGVCDCKAGWGGDDCTEVVETCPNDCSGHGLCGPPAGFCRCSPGFVGDDCSRETVCSSNCSYHGVCIDDEVRPPSPSTPCPRPCAFGPPPPMQQTLPD